MIPAWFASSSIVGSVADRLWMSPACSRVGRRGSPDSRRDVDQKSASSSGDYNERDLEERGLR